ncbi:MAG: hypothetical protein ABF820_07915 [Sporolactobacillus sp.]
MIITKKFAKKRIIFPLLAIICAFFTLFFLFSVGGVFFSEANARLFFCFYYGSLISPAIGLISSGISLIIIRKSAAHPFLSMSLSFCFFGFLLALLIVIYCSLGAMNGM